jgi:cell wall-associated NlpC family hydrolase
LIDVSDSLVSAGMQRRADGVSQFQFSLTNTRRKYDNVFTPNDRIVVVMKRLVWMRTFTGYLNSVPLFSSWPRDVNLSASCSLKRLQYFFWDPGIQASQNLVAASFQKNQDGGAPDGGIKQAVINILEDVVDWSGAAAAKDPKLGGSKIHIGAIPKHWFDFAAKVANSVASNEQEERILAAQLLQTLGASSTIAGQSPGSGGKVPAGTYGSTTLNDTQASNASRIIDTVFSRGLGARDAAYAIGTALDETSLRNLANSTVPASLKILNDGQGNNYDSVGIFQQRPSQGWGTVAECMNIEHATGKFLDVLTAIYHRDSMPFTNVIQTVQRSGTPTAYAVFEDPATRIVKAYTDNINAPTAGNDPNATTTSSTPGANGLPAHGTTSADALVATAQKVVQDNHIQYLESASDSHYDDPHPTFLDCSSFVQWVYFHTIGSINGMPRLAQDQYQWAINHGGKALTPDQGSKTPGALLFVQGANPHVEISLGNYRNIGAHSTAHGVGEGTHGPGYFNAACTLPNIIYPDIPSNPPPTGGSAAANSTSSTNSDFAGILAGALTSADTTTTQQVLAGGSGDPASFDSLFGSLPWNNLAHTQGDGLSNVLTGIRAISNDTPILPYIQNLLNATMRQFCSAPNGDFIAWFPDYYGIWGTAAKMVLQPIEVKDFTVDWSDEFLVTHQFVAGSYDQGAIELDLTSGQVNALNMVYRSVSHGVATIDQPGIMAALFGLDQTPDETSRFTEFIYQRFGPRPNFTPVPTIVAGASGNAEFFMALFLFMQNWTAQYNANIDITFMPELFPGMIIQFPDFNFQAYVQTVTHTVQFGPGGGFSTRINIVAPARMTDSGGEDKLVGLPIAGANGRLIGPRQQDNVYAGRSSTPPKAKNKPMPHANPKLDRILDQQ